MENNKKEILLPDVILKEARKILNLNYCVIMTPASPRLNPEASVTVAEFQDCAMLPEACQVIACFNTRINAEEYKNLIIKEFKEGSWAYCTGCHTEMFQKNKIEYSRCPLCSYSKLKQLS
jgi:hypothetical protein